MTREQAAKLLPVIQAFAEGKTIQVQRNDVWYDVKDRDSLTFESELKNYRIKPEPREFWVVDDADGLRVYQTEAQAQWATKVLPAAIIHVREYTK